MSRTGRPLPRPARGSSTLIPDRRPQMAVIMNPELDELAEMIGTERVVVLLRQFAAELEAFHTPSGATSDATARAHRLVSQAGLLGFHAVSEAAKAFEHSPLPPLRESLLDAAAKARIVVAAFADHATPAPSLLNAR
jgi:HPt (histidine-containing phosphotransfer) domain-containing protein